MADLDLDAMERDARNCGILSGDLARDLIAEVRRLRALPVIEACVICKSCAPVRPLTEPLKFYCTRDSSLVIHEAAPPPLRCPLRSPSRDGGGGR